MMGHWPEWVRFILPAPILYISSVVLAGTALWHLLKRQKTRKPSLIAAWMGATLSALIPQILFALVMFLQGEDNVYDFPILALIPGAGLIIICLSRIFDISTLKALAIYGVCLVFQALAIVPLILYYRAQILPGFLVYLVMLVVSLPIFLAFRSFKSQE